MNSLINKEVFVSGEQQTYITIDEQIIEYDKNFKYIYIYIYYIYSMYLTSTLANPHFSPDMYTNCCVLNFTITQRAMVDQLLSLVIEEMNPENEKKKIVLIKENALNRELKEDVENEILKLLETPGSQILNDENLVKSLGDSKKIAEDIEMKFKSGKATEEKLNDARAVYEAAASDASILYFCVGELASLDPMYQYSIGWYKGNIVYII